MDTSILQPGDSKGLNKQRRTNKKKLKMEEDYPVRGGYAHSPDS